MTRPAALAFSAAELAFLADVMGGTFPGLVADAPPDARVRSDLAGRGILDDSVDGALIVSDPARAAVDAALSGTALTLAASDGGSACLISFFLARAGVVRYEVDPSGQHTLVLVARDAVSRHLDQIAQAVADADAGVEGSVEVDHARLVEAAQLMALGDAAGARVVLPEAPGYLEAFSDARLIATVTSHAQLGARIHVTGVSIVHSRAHGLWLLDIGADGTDEVGSVTIERLSGVELARRLTALLKEVVRVP